MAKVKLPTAAGMAAMQSVEQIQGMQPKYLKIAAAIRISGLSRTHLYGAMGRGLIKYAHVTQGGNSKGIRLINFDSLLSYIEGFLPGGSRYVQTAAMAKGGTNYANL
jgi:hypothetical protein